MIGLAKHLSMDLGSKNASEGFSVNEKLEHRKETAAKSGVFS